MAPHIQDTLLQLFEQVRQDSDTTPPVPIDGWQEGSAEWRLLTSFRSMLEQVQQRTLQLKQAEQQLREREEQYRSVFEATDEGLCIIDLDGFFVEANPAHCKLLGYTYEELIGLHYSETTYPEFYPVLDENIRTIQAGGQFQARGLARRKDGSPLQVEAHSTPFTYKGKPHLLGVMRDISERVQVEERLREKEEQYRAIFEANTDSLTIARLEDAQIVEANPATCKMLGYSYEEVIGLSPVDVVSPDDLPLVAEGLQTIVAGGRSDVLMVALRKDGAQFPVEAHSTRFIYKGKPHLLTISRDITERIAIEQQLREREEQYRSVFEAGTDGLFIIDLEDSHAVEVNPMACQMFGYTREEMLGRPIGISDDTQQIQVHAHEVVRAGRSFQMREITTRKDGTSFYAEVHASPFTYKGKPHLLAIVRDISEQVQAEEQLREKEEQYRGIFEATSDGLIIRNMDGDVVEANPAVCKMHGYTYEEYRNLPRSALIHPDYLPSLAEIIQTVQAGRTFQGQAVDLRKDGSTFPVEFRSDPFMYLGQPHMLTVLHDITERVQAEQQLREKEAQYRGVFEATADALVILDPDGFYVEANPAMCRMFGYTHSELIGLHTSALTAPVSFPVLEESLEKIKVGKGFQAEGQGLRKDGTVFYAEASLTPFTYQGKPHLLAATRNITEQVQAQQLLEQRVEERTRELSSLLDISHTVASTLQLKPLLGLILDQLKTMVDYTGSAILTVEGENLLILGSRSPVPEEQRFQLRFPLNRLGLIWESMTSRESIIIQDVRNDSPLSQAFRVALGEIGETTFYYVRACLIVPLTLREQVIGMLVLTSSEEDTFTQHHAALALAIANQAAIAIENAQLYEQAKELAAIEERQRLARELHDSVSQALYGISLGVHTARTALERNPEHVLEPLDYVLALADAGLAEMRALIFELRPESMETEGLVSALTKQGAALHARYEIAVQAELCEEPDLPLKVKQELYRIAQEAMHNTVKHASASKVDLRLSQTTEAVILEVRDDGVGFEPLGSFPGHLGLHSMRERVTNLGGMLSIESIPGQGTCIRVRVPSQGTV